MQTTGGEEDAISVSNYSVAQSLQSQRSVASGAAASSLKRDWKLLDEYAVLLSEQDAVNHKNSIYFNINHKIKIPFL